MMRSTCGATAAALLCLFVAACGGGGSDPAPPPPPPPTGPTELPASVTIDADARAETGATASFKTSLARTDGISFLWSFGDDATSTDAAPAHVYAKSGSYQIGLTVTNAAKDSRSASFTVNVGYFSNVAGLDCTGGEGSGWCWQDVGVTPHHIEKLDLVPGTPKGWAVGRAGTILVTTDGGDTWTPQASGVTDDLVDLRFSDGANGVVLSSAGYILKTSDAGQTWTRFALPFLTAGAEPKIVAFDDTQIVVTSYEKTFVSHDHGQTWATSPLAEVVVAGEDCWSIFMQIVEKQAGCQGTPVTLVLPPPSPDSPLYVGSASFSDRAHGMILGSAYDASTQTNVPYVWSTSTAGTTWTRSAAHGGASMQMTDDTHAYVYTSVDDAWSTPDAGRTWQAVHPPADMANITLSKAPVIGFLESTRKLWMARERRMAMSLDGVQWQEVDAPDAAWAPDGFSIPSVVSWSDDKNIVASVDGAFYVTHDGGTTWKRVLGADPRDGASSAWFRDSKYGLLAGSGILRATSDGGRTWNYPDPVPDLGYSTWLQAISDQEGWMMAGGFLSHSTDGGETWSRLPSSPPQQPLYMSWGDSKHGWVSTSDFLGESVWSTHDGGETWQKELQYWAGGPIAFEDARTGVVVSAQDGTVFNTTDGGATWQTRWQAPVNSLVQHTGTHTFWIGGGRDDTHVLRSIDGGNTWKTLDVPGHVPFLFLPIAGTDDAHVWLAVQGAILASTDGGETWTSEPIPADVLVTSLFAFDDFTLWGLTYDGPLLATATGGH